MKKSSARCKILHSIFNTQNFKIMFFENFKGTSVSLFCFHRDAIIAYHYPCEKC